MKQYRVFMLLAILLPIVSLSAKDSFGELLKNVVTECKKTGKCERIETDAIKHKEIEDSMILLRKYSGRLGPNEITFFLEIDKTNIVGGTLVVDNELPIPIHNIEAIFREINKYYGKEFSIGLLPNLDLQLTQGYLDEKPLVLKPQCLGNKICSYVVKDNTMFFPDIKEEIMLEEFRHPMDEDLEGIPGESYTHFMFANDSYLSFLDFTVTRNMMGGANGGGEYAWHIDIKTQKTFSLGDNILTKPLPIDLLKKYGGKECKDSNVDECENNYGFGGGYISPALGDFYYNAPLPFIFGYPFERFGSGVSIPLKELKPYLKPEWYNYLIGKGELPKF